MGSLSMLSFNYFPHVEHLARRTVLNFEHADWDNFRQFVSTAIMNNQVRFPTNSVNANWDLFKEIIDMGINKYISKKLSRSSSNPFGTPQKFAVLFGSSES